MNIVITGGAGFIGSHLVECLAEDPDNTIFVLDDYSSNVFRKYINERKRIVEDLVKPNGKLLYCDVSRDTKIIDTLFSENEIDAVIHLAAQVNVDDSMKDPVTDCRVNLIGILNILEACKKHNVKKVVFASSAAVYYDSGAEMIDESAPTLPKSFYGISKLTSEQYLRLYSENYGIQCTALRFANVYGPRQGRNGVISIFADKFAWGEEVCIYGDGNNVRDFIYVKDIAKAIKKALEFTSEKPFNVINISTGIGTSINRLVQYFLEVCDCDVDVKYLCQRDGDIKTSILSNEKCNKLLGFKPMNSVSWGIWTTYKYYREEMEKRCREVTGG